MPDCCRVYERWIERLQAAEEGHQLTTEELQALRGFIAGELENHVQAAGEASWNDDND